MLDSEDAKVMLDAYTYDALARTKERANNPQPQDEAALFEVTEIVNVNDEMVHWLRDEIGAEGVIHFTDDDLFMVMDIYSDGTYSLMGTLGVYNGVPEKCLKKR